MNNTTPEIKNTREGINSRVNEAEKQVSKLENRILEITAVEQKTEKKEMITVSDTSGTTLNTLPFASGVLEGPEKIFEEITADNLTESPLYVNCCLFLVAFNIFSLSSLFVSLITILFWHVPSSAYPAWGFLYFLDLGDCFLSPVRGIFSCYLFKYFFRSF